MPGQAILIVEDESVVALDLKLQLHKFGYTVVGIAASGERAIELAEQSNPSLILMDVRLQGGLDGIQAAERIVRSRHVPIIFLTSHSDDETVQRAARAAPYGYLTKPYQIRELRAGIEVALAKARMERQLREADRWFAQTLRCVADGVVLTDLEGRVSFVNPAAERLTGWGVDEAVGKDIGDVVRLRRRGDALEAVDGEAARAVRRVLAEGRPMPVVHDVGLRGRDGAHTWIDKMTGPVDDENGQRLGAVLILRDATERVAHEDALRASEERFRGAFDHAPLGMALVSLGGGLIQVNAALCDLLGASAEALRRRPLASMALEADQDHEARRLNELTHAPGGVVQFERQYARLDGRGPVPALVSVSLMREGGQPTCYLYQIHDLTEQKRAAEHLAELANERMRREASDLANKAKSDFLSRASHEMRTPLNAVLGFAQLLELQQDADPERTLAYAKHIRAAGEHLLHLVNDLLDLNRAAQGTLRIELGAIPLAQAVDEALRLLQTQATSHGIDLCASVDADLFVVGDAVRLRQVLLNLGSNAIKYNREGGGVTFRAERLVDGRTRLSIVDTGIGMTREQLVRLYQPFDRLGQERTQIPGVGLGLVIARGLVVEMGGELTVSSQPRAGTTVHLDMASPA